MCNRFFTQNGFGVVYNEDGGGAMDCDGCVGYSQGLFLNQATCRHNKCHSGMLNLGP